MSEPNAAVSTIAEFLSRNARERGDQLALVTPAARVTYRELARTAERCCRGLSAVGVRPGMRCVLMVQPGLEFVALVFALIRLGAILVLVDPGIGRRYLAKCLAEARPEVFIGTSKAQFARLLMGWAKRTLSLHITVGRRWCWGGPTFARILKAGSSSEPAVGLKFGEQSADDVAAVVFTSGSTGPPKGVVYTHRMFLAQARLLQEEFSIRPGEVDLATFPLFALYDVAWGATTVLPRMDFTRPGRVNPCEILSNIRRHGVTHMFGSPALLDRVGRYAARQGIVLPRLRRVLSAGAPVGTNILCRFAGLLSGEAEVFTPYGATEALPVTWIGHRERLAEDEQHPAKGVCVGRPFRGVEVAVIRITDEPVTAWSEELRLPAGEVGEIVVWGPNVSSRYDGRPEADRLSKICSEDGVVRHRMGDLGSLDEEGRVWFCGRKSQRVVTTDGVLFTVPCESIFNQHPAVFRTALVGVRRPPRQKPALCVELEDKARWRGSPDLKAELLKLGAGYPHTRQIQTILFHRSFPVDVRHNSKIFRERLAQWATQQLGESE